MTRTTREPLAEHYGHWEVLDRDDHRAKINVRCTLCDTTHQVQRTKLLNGLTKSCRRCSPRKRGPGIGKTWRTEELAPDRASEVVDGARFGRLTVRGEILPTHKHSNRCREQGCEREARNNRSVECECSCPERTVTIVAIGHLLSETDPTRSCGCLKRDAGRALHTL